MKDGEYNNTTSANGSGSLGGYTKYEKGGGMKRFLKQRRRGIKNFKNHCDYRSQPPTYVSH